MYQKQLYSNLLLHHRNKRRGTVKKKAPGFKFLELSKKIGTPTPPQGREIAANAGTTGCTKYITTSIIFKQLLPKADPGVPLNDKS